ncbi:MAG TPA: helix-turn-helix transcriptional regulator [Longimicrobium sp.]|nr:helix-turn-helix transcriptional regulator [Longimicrobium sp.]
MLPLELKTAREIAGTIARRARALRLHRGWTQQEMADRAGVTLASYRRFERTGSISLERLLKVAIALGAYGGLEQLFAPPPAASLAELERLEASEARKRGRRRDAKP